MAVIDTRPISTVTTSFSGTLLNIREQQLTASIRNYSGSASIQTVSPFGYSLDTAGNANSSEVTGSFDYRTDETIVQNLGENAYDGILEIFGEGLGTARIAIFDANIVRIQVDANGSSNYEITVDMPWDEFLNGTGGLQ
jgi:hypothetical protein